MSHIWLLSMVANNEFPIFYGISDSSFCNEDLFIRPELNEKGAFITSYNQKALEKKTF